MGNWESKSNIDVFIKHISYIHIAGGDEIYIHVAMLFFKTIALNHFLSFTKWAAAYSEIWFKTLAMYKRYIAICNAYQH